MNKEQNLVDAMKLQMILTRLLPKDHVSYNQSFQEVCLKWYGCTNLADLPEPLSSVIRGEGKYQDKHLPEIVTEIQNELLRSLMWWEKENVNG